MKVLRVITSMNPKSGGPSQGIRNINSHLVRLGLDVEAVCTNSSDEEYRTQDDFVIHKIGKGKTSYQYQPLLLEWLNKNILNYDVVVVHGLWQYHNLAVYQAIKKLKKQDKKVPKVVILPHGMLDPYFQKAPERKLKAIRNELMWRLSEKKCLNAADAIFFTCEEEMRLAATTFKGYKPKKTINIGYGIQHPPVNNDEFKLAFEQKCPAIKGKKYWLFLSRIHEKKGVDLLIKAYNLLALENKSLPILVIAGPTDSVYAKQMIALSEDNPKIHFPGMLQGAEKWGAFYGCDTYLLPSHQENFGIAIVEAMACKKPVVISKHVNIWKEIETGNGGWILNELDEPNIHSTLSAISCLSDLEIIQKGEDAQEAFENNFNVKERAAVFVDALKQL
jgi:glycosyltransferase involved in cell wall biosynthesis